MDATKRSTSIPHRLIAIAMVVTSVFAVAGPAFAFDGELLETDDTNLVNTPYRVAVSGGKYHVTTRIEKIPMDCPVVAYGCFIQFRLAHKCTGFWCTWYDHPLQTISSPFSLFTLTSRCAGGNHYWKVMYRTGYKVTATQTNRWDYGLELGYKGDGTLNTVYRGILKAVLSASAGLGVWVSGSKTVTATPSQTNYSEWMQVDASSGTVNTVC